MLSSLPPIGFQDLPPAGDAALAALGLTRWIERAAEEDAETASRMVQLAEDPVQSRLLAAVFGNSPFLTQCCLREPNFLLRLLRLGPDATFAELLAALNDHFWGASDRTGLMQDLRIFKRRSALLIAIADIAAWWPLERVTAGLSGVAEAALAAAADHLLRQAHDSGDLVLPHPDRPGQGSGLIVLGMGKLGARELNYSSDIDLIVLFEEERVRYFGRENVPQRFARMARDLVRLMDERTEDGYVFRTDLRLRPDPASTPPALSVLAALTYYESAGQNWERAALIKARPVAGDIAAGERFLAELRPFLWRKYLDFAAVQDIHSIKRQIHAHKGGGRIAVLGHNIKLGRGGIREIEFFAQTQQLIWGGRMPALRVSGTCEALAELAAMGRIPRDTAEQMTAAYRFLRRVEHRLQMIDDQQVHSLPADATGLTRLAAFLGYATKDDFTAELLRHLSTVEGHYARLFEEAPTLSAQGNLVFTGSEDDPETLATIRSLGYADPKAVTATVRGWHHGRYRAMRSQRARELLTEIVPGLLTAFGRTANPDTAFMRFDQLLERLPAGVQLLSLFHANPGILDTLAEIMGGAPRLADQLAQRPNLLDGVLAAGFFDPLPDCAALSNELARQLAAARDYEDLLEIARRWARDRRFQIGAQILRGSLDGAKAGEHFADVAESVIAALLARVSASFTEAHGTVEGGEAVVLALGKLGGREMTTTSDLDLIWIYDAPAGVDASEGGHPLPVSTYYMRLWQRLVNALTALTAEGTLYEVDMRLRPSGTKGPIATSFEGFRRYHQELAWTWEHMALTRARVVAGSPGLARGAISEVHTILARPRDRQHLVLDVADMRARIAAQHRNPSPWDVKHRRGGFIDIEFIAQYLELRDAFSHPEIPRQNTAAAIEALSGAGAIETATAQDLLRALTLWRNVQGLVKLAVEEPFDEIAASPALRAILVQGAGAVDFEALKADMDAAAACVSAHFETLIEAPAAAVRAPERAGLAEGREGHENESGNRR